MKLDSKSKRREHLQTRISGLKKHCSKQKFVFNGVSVTGAELIKILEDQLKLMEQTEAARMKWQYLMKQERSKEVDLKPMSKQLETFVANQFGAESPIFLEFGFKPRKVAKKSVTTKAGAVAKQKATRDAQHPVVSAPVLNGITNGISHA